MPTTTTPTQERQERWQEIASDPLLSELPYKVETNQRGQIVLSPHQFSHSELQRTIQKKLDAALPGGEVFPECPITTEEGVRQADVTWASKDRVSEMKQTGDPPTLAPEICVEAMSGSNDWEEMREKRRLYVEAGAEEVWVVGEGGAIWFWDSSGQLDSSEIAPDFPDKL